MMSIKRPNPDVACDRCGLRPELTLHDDGSIRSLWHKCAKPVPGPQAAPWFFHPGEYFPNADAIIKKLIKWHIALTAAEGEKPRRVIIPEYDTNDRTPREAKKVEDYLSSLARIASTNMVDLVAVPWGWLQDAARELSTQSKKGPSCPTTR